LKSATLQPLNLLVIINQLLKSVYNCALDHIGHVVDALLDAQNMSAHHRESVALTLVTVVDRPDLPEYMGQVLDLHTHFLDPDPSEPLRTTLLRLVNKVISTHPEY
jgi:hypothetical protein